MSFSIILPTYNRAKKISLAIQSVLDQSISDWELIVVDDGSTDETKSVVSTYIDRRIQYFHQPNSERAAARNLGIEKATNKWICFLDSDDYYLPNHLETFQNHIDIYAEEKPFLATLSYTETNEIRTKNSKIHIQFNEAIAKEILRSTSITPINVCILKEFLEHNKFEEEYKKAYWEDTHLWIRLSIKFSFNQIEEYTSVLVQHENRSVDSRVSISRVNDHVGMIKGLYFNYPDVQNVFSKEEFISYCDRKFRTFLYVTRQNKQVFTALIIWMKSIRNKFSFYLLTEFPKIFINFIGIGIHER
jgi:glycosyltransferase involved in cell wall biosynthesis